MVMERDPILLAFNEKTLIIMPSICNHDPLEDTVWTTVFLPVGAGKNTGLNSQLLWLLFPSDYKNTAFRRWNFPYAEARFCKDQNLQKKSVSFRYRHD